MTSSICLTEPSIKRDPILMLAYHFPPENTSGAARPFRFSKYLNHLGYESQVVASDQGMETGGPNNVHRTPSPTVRLRRIAFVSHMAGLLERMIWPYNDCLPWVPYAIATTEKLLLGSTFSAILSTSPPIATHLAAMYLKIHFPLLKWIADFRDPLFGNPFRTRPLAHFGDAVIERMIFRHADAIIANTDGVAELWSQRHPQWRKKISLIWNGFDPDEKIPACQIPQRGYRVFVHAGDIYGGRHPGLLLSSVARLIQRGLLDPCKLRIRLIGPLDEDSVLRRLPDFHKLVEEGCLEFNGQLVPRAEALQSMAEADFLLLLDVNEVGSAFQVPAKIFDYIRIGRPILAITSPDSPVHRILLGSRIPFACLFRSDNETELDSKVLQFLQLPNEPATPSQWFWHQFNAHAQAETLASIINQVQASSAQNLLVHSAKRGQEVFGI